MSFLSDVAHGNFGNLGTDLSHDPVGTGIAAGALALGTAGLALPALGADLALGGEGIGTLIGGTAGDTLITGGAGDAAFTGGATIGGGSAAAPGIGMSSIAADAGGGIGMSSIATDTVDASAAGGTNLFSQLTQGAGSLLGKNPLGTAVAGGGLLYSVLNANKTLPTTNAIQGAANQYATTGQSMITSGQNLETYLTNGTLPPALQAQVTQQVKAAKAAAIARAAKMGMSTDPAQNSSLATDLANIDQQGLILAGTLEQNLYSAGNQSISQGAQFLGMTNQDLIALSNIQQTQQANVGKSIASFAAALGGGGSVGGKQGTITFNA